MNCGAARQRRFRELYRSREDRVIFGVCAGLSEYTEIPVVWIRLAMVVLQCFFFPPLFLFYILARIIMPANPWEQGHGRRPVPPPPPPPPPPHAADRVSALDLGRQFDDLEEKIRRLEDHVTSREFILRRKFDEL